MKLVKLGNQYINPECVMYVRDGSKFRELNRTVIHTSLGTESYDGQAYRVYIDLPMEEVIRRLRIEVIDEG